MADKLCGNCAYYHPTDKDRQAGECRCNTPVVFMKQNEFYTHWPMVDALDWCGQFMSAENLYQKKKKG